LAPPIGEPGAVIVLPMRHGALMINGTTSAAWAVSAPRSVELRRHGKLNPAAIRWFHKDIL
jgi:hypothetical protein